VATEGRITQVHPAESTSELTAARAHLTNPLGDPAALNRPRSKAARTSTGRLQETAEAAQRRKSIGAQRLCGDYRHRHSGNKSA